MIRTNLIEHLTALGTATLYEGNSQEGAMDAGIKPIANGMRMAGPVLPVQTRPGDNLMLHFAVTKANPGDILVVDAAGFTEVGHWGDVLTAAAQSAKIAGLVIDGAVRDAVEIAAMGFPVFARGISIKAPWKSQRGAIGERIHCGGISVSPGDIIVGDDDGLVVIARSRLDQAVANAEARQSKEDMLKEQIRGGRTTLDLLGLEKELHRLGLR